MMTDKTPAMPPLPEPEGGYSDHGGKIFTPNQMDAHYLKGYEDALAALQSAQPAAAGVTGAVRPQADHPDTARCIKARNDLNAALHGEGALIDDLEHAVANACAKLKRRRSFADERADFESWMSEGGKWPKAVERSQNGDYLLLQTATNWITWQACASLRPQAVPMTRAQRLEVFRKAEDRMAHDINLCWRDALIEETEAHHGITQRADGGEE